MSMTDHSREQPEDNALLDIAPLELDQTTLDLLLYGNAYRDADTGFPIKATKVMHSSSANELSVPETELPAAWWDDTPTEAKPAEWDTKAGWWNTATPNPTSPTATG